MEKLKSKISDYCSSAQDNNNKISNKYKTTTITNVTTSRTIRTATATRTPSISLAINLLITGGILLAITVACVKCVHLNVNSKINLNRDNLNLNTIATPLEYIEENEQMPAAEIQAKIHDQIYQEHAPTIYLTHTHEEVGDVDVEVLTTQQELNEQQQRLQQQQQLLQQQQQHHQIPESANGVLVSSANAFNNNNQHHLYHHQHHRNHQHNIQQSSKDYFKLRNSYQQQQQQQPQQQNEIENVNEKRSHHHAKHSAKHHQHQRNQEDQNSQRKHQHHHQHQQQHYHDRHHDTDYDYYHHQGMTKQSKHLQHQLQQRQQQQQRYEYHPIVSFTNDEQKTHVGYNSNSNSSSNQNVYKMSSLMADNNNNNNNNNNNDDVTLSDISNEVPKHIYHSKYTIDDLLTKVFQHQISNDIDMDPCKAGGFMGDIALPDIKYDNDYPIVAFTHANDDMKQSDAPINGQYEARVSDNSSSNKFNETFQKEIEILKQEVYHEGLQVEEEGLTDIMRRKTKIPTSKYDLNTDYINSANELIKPLDTNFNMNYNFHLNKHPNKNEIFMGSNENPSNHHRKYAFDKKEPQEKEDIIPDKVDLHQNFNVTLEKFPFLIFTEQKFHEDENEKKINKSTIGLGNRNVDHRKIQSNTKDIELDTGNNFISERKFVILPTVQPIQRTTLPNVYSNAGGNGMKLDDIQEFKGSSTIIKKRHRRGRKNRPILNANQKNDYQYKLQKLKEELNRPVDRLSRTIQSDKYHQQHQHQSHSQSQHVQHQKFYHDRKSRTSLIDDYLNRDILSQSSYKHNHSYPKSIYHVPSPEDNNNDFNMLGNEHRRRLPRALTAKKERIWDYGVIPYEIDGNFSGLHKALFKQAMRHWENFTCIKFVERDPELHPNYIVFTIRGCGCCSFVGKRGNGPQAISIGRNCDKFGIVVHELGHVVGFWHEHTRPDREKHVVIEPNNIMKGQEYNFNKLTPDEVNSLGMPYDYDSIMHYARNTFSKGTYLDTILPVEVKGKKRPEIGQRLRLSSGDIAQANLLYKCPMCGRTFQEDNGLFTSPSFYMSGTLPNDTEHCEWRITATHGERVILRLENLNIFKSENCQTDYLEIRDGYYYKSPLIARYCGKISHEVLTSESSRMLLTYVNKHRSDGFRGFKAEFDVICGGEITIDDNESRLESPNYPLDYLPKKECVWMITAPKGYQVALKFQSFEVENHDSCVYDFVEVRDGPDQNSPLIGVFCGYKPPPNMKSTGDTMYVKFVSDTSVQKPGFSATFMKEVDECELKNHGCEHECINTLGGYECGCHIGYELHSDKKHCEDACGGVIEYPNGTITSPSFPDKYPMLKDCIWEIIAPPKYKISLNFTHFDLEGAAHHQSECGYDKVTIYSKLSESRLKRIGTYCGSTIPPTATSEGNALRIEFHSDKSIQTSGFAAVFFMDVDECSVNNGGCQHECRNTIGSYICSCHNGYSLHENGHDCKEGECKHEISAPFGTIYSPNYPDLYPPNADCVWHFSTTPGHRIKLIFNEFKLESHQECSYDNIIIYDGDSENSSMLGRFCGDKIPYPISSSTNQLYMVLKTDKNKQHSGFTAVHSTSCGGYLRATSQIQQFYSHSRYGNHDYDRNMDCEWLIQAPISSNVQLIFLTFDLETSDNCTYDYVQVFSGMEDTSGPMYGQFCGNTLPQDIISLTDSLLIRFKTDDSIAMKGFSASYVAVDPFENSEEDEDEDLLIYSSEMVTPFPGSLKSIYKEDDNSQETDDYNDFNENRLVVNNNPYSMNRYLMTFG